MEATVFRAPKTLTKKPAIFMAKGNSKRSWVTRALEREKKTPIGRQPDKGNPELHV